MGRGMLGERPPVNEAHPSYVTVYQAAGGWQTMCVWWNPEPIEGMAPNGYEEPYETGQGPYRYQLAAAAEAEAWAKAWGLELKGVGEIDPKPAQGVRETLRQTFPDIIEVDLPTLSHNLRQAASKGEP